MFCKKCGKEIPNGFSSCPYCDNSSSASPMSSGEPMGGAPFGADPFGMPPAPKKSGKGKKIAIIASIATAVVATIAIVLVLILSGGDDTGRNDGKKVKKGNEGYIQEVETFLDFLADKEDEPEKFFSDFYCGGRFGTFFCGDDSMDEHEIILEAMFESDWNTPYYGGYDNWEDYMSDMIEEELYGEIPERFDVGDDWELTYDITDSSEMSDDELEDLQDIWDDLVEYYDEEILSEVSHYCSSRDVRKVEKFVDKMADQEIEEAYEVEVEVKVEGDEDVENVFEFRVAKVDKEWVILEGPDLDEIFEQ